MDEEGSDLGRIPLRIEKVRLPPNPLISAVKSLAFAPAPTSDDDGVNLGLRHEVGSIRDQLAVHTVHALQCGLKLFGCVVVGLQSPHDASIRARKTAESPVVACRMLNFISGAQFYAGRRSERYFFPMKTK